MPMCTSVFSTTSSRDEFRSSDPALQDDQSTSFASSNYPICR